MFNLIIYSHKGLFFKNKIESLTISNSEGYMTILAKHSPLVSTIRLSQFYFMNEKNEKKECFITSGIIYVSPKNVYLIADSVDYLATLNEKRLLNIQNKIQNHIEAMNDKKMNAILKRDLKKTFEWKKTILNK